MKMLSLVSLGGAVFFALPALAADFRNVSWGQSTEEVIRAEGRAPEHQEAHGKKALLVYQDKVGTYDCDVVYIFAFNELVRAKYVPTTEHSNNNAYLDDFDTWADMLSGKYGKVEAKTYWSNDLYRSDRSEWGMALAVGHLSKYAKWDRPDTVIILALNGENFKVSLSVEYSSVKLEQLEKEAEKAEENDKL